MKNSPGFTLIELIGVLAIIAILASAIAPNLANEVSRAHAQAEDNSLETLADGFKRAVVDQHRIPAATPGQWDATVASYCALPSQTITQNKGTGSRRLISRPTNDLGGIPYDQEAHFTAGASAQGTLPTTSPLQTKLLLISNLSTAVSNLNVTNADFDAIWEQNGTIPAGFKQNTKIRIHRISLSQYFYPVTLNCQSTVGSPRWSIDNAAPKNNTVATFTVYLMTGTRINVYTNATLIATLIVNKPVGLIYDGLSWRY